MIYLDSSALVKLLFDEPESSALDAWMSAHAGSPMVSSVLARVEVMRTCRRIDTTRLPDARVLLVGLNAISLTDLVLTNAAELDDPFLRSLDAVHLASALSVREALSAFVAYDHRLADAASSAGLDVHRPGA